MQYVLVLEIDESESDLLGDSIELAALTVNANLPAGMRVRPLSEVIAS